jgi:hypothetical protein
MLINNDNLSIVVRAVDERTLIWCKTVLAFEIYGASEGLIDTMIPHVSNGDFHSTLRQSLEVGLSAGKKWHLVVDADVIPYSGSCAAIIAWADNCSMDVSVVQPHVCDKLLGVNRPAGVHLYRTSYIAEIIELLKLQGPTLRPETAVLLKYEKLTNRKFVNVPVLFGAHDFEQSYEDLFRKSFQHGIKHSSIAPMLLQSWFKKSADDPDFKVALFGYLQGYMSAERNCIDAKNSNILVMFKSILISEKPPLTPFQFNSKSLKKVYYNPEVSRIGFLSCLPYPNLRMESSIQEFSSFIKQIFINIGVFKFAWHCLHIGCRRIFKKN